MIGFSRFIAIIDSDRGGRRAIGSLLRAHGFLPQGFASAEAFLARGRTDDPACLVLDVERRVFAHPCLMKVPLRSSATACCSSALVFITIGPYQATGSSIGLPETSKNLMPSSPASTVTSSPRSKSTSERLSASAGGWVSAHSTASVGTANGPEALQNFPAPPKT